jgi:putative chitinase
VIQLNADTLRAIAPRFGHPWHERQQAIIDALGPVLTATLAEYEINTLLRIAHFLAQVCHESAGLRTTQEFADGSAYEGRRDLGNTQPGDGKRYKGRGLIQLTGRANYRSLGAVIDRDLEGFPEQAAEPVLSLRIACEYWKSRGLNGAADTDDPRLVTRLINGGYNGFDDRLAYLAKARLVLERAMPDFSDVESGVEK